MNIALDTSYSGRVRGAITYGGVLYSNFVEMFPRCSEGTLIQYAQIFNRAILPELGDVPIAECTEERLNMAIEKICKTKPYSINTIEKYVYLTTTVVEFAMECGYMEKAVFGPNFTTGRQVSARERLLNELKQNRKSLYVWEEIKIWEELSKVSPEKSKGTDYGLLLMFSSGLRNHEACGTNFEAIIPLHGEQGLYALWLYESTEDGTSELQEGGKTANMGRKIPLYPRVAERILELKEYRRLQVERGEIVLGEGESVDTIPIVWSRNNYTKHCTSDELSAAGRVMLRSLTFDQDRFDELIRAAEEEMAEDESIPYKDPTAYLKRRNFGTHLAILGLSDEEIAYLLGHKIEDNGLNRNMFSNDDRILAIYEKMRLRPLLGDLEAIRECELSEENPFVSFDNVSGVRINFEAEEEAVIRVRFSTLEPIETAHLNFWKGVDGEDADITVRMRKRKMNEAGSVNTGISWANVLFEYHEAYNQILKKKSKRRKGDIE